MSKISNWEILRQINSQFLPTVERIFVFGLNGREVLIVTKDDLVFVFGDNRNCCLGLGNNKPIQKPRIVDELCNKGIVKISHGYSHVIALTSDGKTYSWGSNSYGELGNSTTLQNKIPKLIDDFSDIQDISCGDYHTIALTRTGSLYSWGLNTYGQLGDSTTENSYKPTLVKGFDEEKIIGISCGLYHSIALSECGRVFIWGNSYCGQLGLGYCEYKCSPTPIVYDSNDVTFKKVVCGAYHSLLLSTNGEIYSFGFNKFGQIGNKSNFIQNIPTLVKNEDVFSDIAAKNCDNISIALLSNNRAFIWGECDNGVVINAPIQVNYEFECINDVFALFSKSKTTYQAINFDSQYSMLESQNTNSESVKKKTDISLNKFLKLKVKVSKLSKSKN